MIGKAAGTGTVVLVGALVVAVVLFGPQIQSALSGFGTGQVTGTGNVPTPSGGGVTVNTALVTIRLSGVNAINGTAALTNGYLYRSPDNARLVGETSIVAAGASISTTVPNNFDGYIMLGNDPNIGTDRGNDYYFRKIPVSFSGMSGDYPVTSTDMYGIVAPTYTFYDDGTAEATANLTVGSGQAVVTSEIKIAVTGTDGALGNPDPLLLKEAQTLGLTVGDRPLAGCFNESTAGLFEKIRPNNIVKSIPTPGILSGRSVVECHVLDTPALIDGKKSEYRFGVTYESKTGQNPAIAATSFFYPLDLEWYLNDKNVWVPGWEDASDVTADTEIGLAGEANTLTVNLA